MLSVVVPLEVFLVVQRTSAEVGALAALDEVAQGGDGLLEAAHLGEQRVRGSSAGSAPAAGGTSAIPFSICFSTSFSGLRLLVLLLGLGLSSRIFSFSGLSFSGPCL